MHRFELKDAQHWMEKTNLYRAKHLLLGASTMGIDACPIEGFNPTVSTSELGLRDKGATPR